MPYRGLAFLQLALGLMACIGCDSRSDDAPRPPAQATGVRGTVTEFHAGSHGDGASEPDRITPLSVPVHVFRGRIRPYQGPAGENPAYFASVTADADGHYEIDLPPGEYTIVAEDQGRPALYEQNPDPAGLWPVVKVEEGQTKMWDIVARYVTE